MILRLASIAGKFAFCSANAAQTVGANKVVTLIIELSKVKKKNKLVVKPCHLYPPPRNNLRLGCLKVHVIYQKRSCTDRRDTTIFFFLVISHFKALPVISKKRQIIKLGIM